MKQLLFTERGLLLSVAPNTKNKIALDNPLHTTFLFCRAAELHNIPLPIREGSQPEQNFFDFLNSNEDVFAFYDKIYPDLYRGFELKLPDCFMPYHVHPVIAYGFNKWLGGLDTTPVVSFKPNASLSEIIGHLYEGYPVILSKSFIPQTGISQKRLRHLSLLTGLIYKRESIKNLDLNRPAGQNTLKLFTPNYFVFDDLQGKESHISFNDYMRYYTNIRSEEKFAHFFNPLASLYLPRR